jgi:hypothetical protein
MAQPQARSARCLHYEPKFSGDITIEAKQHKLNTAMPPMKPGQRYVCVNPLCRSEIEVIYPSMETSANPKCACGAEMKKPYTTPVFRRLRDQPPEFGFVEKKRRALWPSAALPC